MSGSIGIYFGPKLISLVENKGRKIVKQATISRIALSEGELEEKVPEEVKIVAVFNDELRRNQIEAKEATISLSGRDLIVRTFELPTLPPNELGNAVNFEAKKYIPFKVEDLVSDFQVEYDRRNRKNLVLFVGIKKEALDKYLSILKQLNIKVNNIDYSAFSVLRLLKLAGLGNRGVVAIISTDIQEEDEANFTVLENGFPVFSRDISLLSSSAGGPARPEEADSGMVLEKLKTEIRISFDYYHRKYPNKNIESVYLVANENYRMDLESFMKDMDLSFRFVDISKIIGSREPFSLSLIKGYGASLSKIVKTNLKINLLAPKAKITPAKKISIAPEQPSLFTDLRVDPRVITLGIVFCIAAFGYGFYRTLPVRNELAKIIGSRPKVENVDPEANYEDLKKIDSEYMNKIKSLDGLIKKQLYLTEMLDIIPRNIPEDMWLTDFSFQQEESKAELSLRGFVYLGDNDKELTLLNSFITKLKEVPAFSKYFKEIFLVSAERSAFQKITVTSFTILCRRR